MNIEEMKNSRREADIKEHYKVADGINLPVHVFFPENHKEGDKTPAVVCIHGGSWGAIADNSEWDSGIMSPQARYFAARGAVGITISYRNYTQPDKEREEGKAYPKLYDLYLDCRDAILYIKENAHRFGIDPEKIAVIGDSAGGHLASCLGTLGNMDETLVNAVIACNPITDLTDPAWVKYIKCDYKGADEEEIIKRAKEVSPLYNIPNNPVPMIFMHGTEDDCVIPRHSVDFYNKMNELGFDCELKLFQGATHAFIIVGYTATDEQIAAAMDESDKFLVSIGFLNQF